MAKLRLGRKLSKIEGLQTIYIQEHDEPLDSDPCIGMIRNLSLAQAIVTAVNSSPAFEGVVMAYETDPFNYVTVPPKGAEPKPEEPKPEEPKDKGSK